MSDKPLPEAKLAIAATFTVEPLLPFLGRMLSYAGLELGLEAAPYDQVFQELLSGTGLLAGNAGGINVLMIRVEDLTRRSPDPDAARTLLARGIGELSDALAAFAGRAKSPTVLIVTPPAGAATEELHAEFAAAKAALLMRAAQLAGFHLISSEELDAVSTGESYDRVSDELAHIPFTDDFYGSLALVIARKVHAIRVPPHKVLVLDCDNTLWSGVVGEVGVDGIAMTPAALRLQRFAVEQQRRGSLICLASKNAEQDVLEVLERRVDMALRPEHIVAHRINWKPKPANMLSLAAELNLGLDSFVFIDDNPIECAEMRSALPQVVTLQLRPDESLDFLDHLWAFDKVAVTSEDSRRTSLYRENAARQQFEASSNDIASFIESLDLKIDIAAPQEEEWARVAQLTQRTNQFNFTTLRRSEPELRGMRDSGVLVLRVNVKDRFGDYGLVGLMVADAAADALRVDTMLLSCRVLGRGVEHAMLRRLGELAVSRNLPQVRLRYVRTPKNEPALAFADSVVSAHRAEDEQGFIYRIPAGEAAAIAHRPGFDPEAVIRASRSEEKRPAQTAESEAIDRSTRYARLAFELTSGSAVVRATRAAHAVVRMLPTAIEAPSTETERKLLSLWQELFGISSLGVEDDYVALGGTSLLAARLFAEIAQRFGVKLPLTTILDAPDVRSLARHVDGADRELTRNLIELKRGGTCGLFLVHDGDGETLLYANLARHLPDAIGVTGIEPLRMPGIPLAHDRIEDMANFYVAEIRKQQPSGPYLLGGLCAGGVIAYEMASQLRRSGEEVKLVAMLDSASPRAVMRAGYLAGQRTERFKQMIAQARQERAAPLKLVLIVANRSAGKLLRFLSWQIASRTKSLSSRIRIGALRQVLRRNWSWPRILRRLSVREIYDAAESRYIPQPIVDVRVLLVKAREGSGSNTPFRDIFEDATFGWNEITPHVDVVDVDGGHSSMLQEPFVERLAVEIVRRANLDGARPVTSEGLERTAEPASSW
jgi:FkbH-like protein